MYNMTFLGRAGHHLKFQASFVAYIGSRWVCCNSSREAMCCGFTKPMNDSSADMVSKSTG